MSINSKPNILIVGGGAAGWMSALYLNKLYNDQEQLVDISVLESPDIGIIGVGEATVHTIRSFFAALGLDETELLAASNATLKAGILFKQWRQARHGKSHEYFHPFEQQHIVGIDDVSTTWILDRENHPERYDEAVSIAAHLIKTKQCAKAENSSAYSGVVPYGYHLDATLMARYLRDTAKSRGVKHIEARVTDVQVHHDQIVSVLTTEGPFNADLYLDCTGFRGLLINALHENNWVSYEDALPCNRAVAMQVEYRKGESPNPYTTATALTNGWVWEIDLAHRRGTGYVYDGNRLSADQAEAELSAHLGIDAKVLKSLHLQMKVGRQKQFWIGNCIAIGLSGGFIEPLESTGLHLINLSLRLLATHTPINFVPQSIRDSYNKIMVGFYEDLKRFIVLHYCLTDREDTAFWKEAKLKAKYCSHLPELLNLWQHKVCEFADLADSFSTVFTDENYRYVLYGMDYYPTLSKPLKTAIDRKAFAQIERRIIVAKNSALSHTAYLNYLKRSAPEAAIS